MAPCCWPACAPIRMRSQARRRRSRCRETCPRIGGPRCARSATPRPGRNRSPSRPSRRSTGSAVPMPRPTLPRPPRQPPTSTMPTRCRASAARRRCGRSVASSRVNCRGSGGPSPRRSMAAMSRRLSPRSTAHGPDAHSVVPMPPPRRWRPSRTRCAPVSTRRRRGRPQTRRSRGSWPDSPPPSRADRCGRAPGPRGHGPRGPPPPRAACGGRGAAGEPCLPVSPARFRIRRSGRGHRPARRRPAAGSG